MRILHIVPAYKPAYRYGGPIESVHALNKALVNAGEHVEVFTTNKDGDDVLDVNTTQAISVDGVLVNYFPISFPKNWFYSSHLRTALASRIREFDIVHITSVFLSASTLGSYYARKYKIPYIISPRGSFMSDPMTRKSLKKKIYITLLEKKNLLSASAIHFTTEKEAGEYCLMFPCNKKIISPNVIEGNFGSLDRGAFREKFGISEKCRLAIFLGRLHPIKGFDTLIPAWEIVRKKFKDAILVIAGENESGYRRDIEHMIKNLENPGGIIFTGPLDKNSKFSALRDADVLVVPSYSENFSMVAAEAMSEKLPVVVTPEVGISDVVASFHAGIVSPKQPDIFADAIMKIFNTPNAKEEYGGNGIRAVRENFAPDLVARNMVREYSRIEGSSVVDLAGKE